MNTEEVATKIVKARNKSSNTKIIDLSTYDVKIKEFEKEKEIEDSTTK